MDESESVYILNSDIDPYPTSISMPSESQMKQDVCSRIFEVAMIIYSVDLCACCGRVHP